MTCNVEDLPTPPSFTSPGTAEPPTTEEQDDDDEDRRRTFNSLRERLGYVGGLFEYGMCTAIVTVFYECLLSGICKLL